MTTIQDAGEDLLRKLDVLFPGQACDTLALAQAVSRLIDAKLASAAPPPSRDDRDWVRRTVEALTPQSFTAMKTEADNENSRRWTVVSGTPGMAFNFDARFRDVSEVRDLLKSHGWPLRDESPSPSPVSPQPFCNICGRPVDEWDSTCQPGCGSAVVTNRRAVEPTAERKGQGEPLPRTLPKGTTWKHPGEPSDDGVFVDTATLWGKSYQGYGRNHGEVGTYSVRHVPATWIDWRSPPAAQTPEPVPRSKLCPVKDCPLDANHRGECWTTEEPSESGKGEAGEPTDCANCAGMGWHEGPHGDDSAVRFTCERCKGTGKSPEGPAPFVEAVARVASSLPVARSTERPGSSRRPLTPSPPSSARPTRARREGRRNGSVA